eukprot:m51a1_g631 putative dynamin like protein (742) ;mRNA; r:147922-150599
MDQLIPVVNRLQDVFAAIGRQPLDLPQVVVVGSQSSGKSSVLEHIVGRDFLPRGTNIVTRRPLVLHLVHRAGEGPEEWGEFLHKPGAKYSDFGAVRDEIQAATNEVAGRNRGVARVPITLTIHSPHVVNLTLVDLPGITRIPVGDQPGNIEEQLREMILEYISKPNAIILAVTPANTDISTSDALKLARSVDPDGLRTLGVLTKLDLMDRGTDAMDVLTGHTVSLKLGYVGVVNRAQEDITSGTSIKDALANERRFFESHPQYKSISYKLGTPYLGLTLNKLLMQHIKSSLPELRQQITRMLMDARSEMSQYSDGEGAEAGGKSARLLRLIMCFCQDFSSAIDGRLAEPARSAPHELRGGARINHVFQEVFGKSLAEMDPTGGMTYEETRLVIKIATGPRDALFVPEMAFETLVRQQVSRLEDPSLSCVDYVYDELHRIVGQLEATHLSRYENLRKAVVDVVHDLLSANRVPAREMVRNLIRIELAHINTAHPDFIGGERAVALVSAKLANASRGSDAAAALALPARKPVPRDSTIARREPVAIVSDTDFNEHLDACLERQNRGQDAAPRHGFWGIFGSGATTTAAQKLPVSCPATPSLPSATGSKTQREGDAELQSPMASPVQERAARADSNGAQQQSAVADRERFETELIRTLVGSYFMVVRKSIRDLVPKAVMHFLVNNSKETLQSKLVQELYKEDRFDDLLQESPEVGARRTACAALIEVLQKAYDIVNEVRDYVPS